MMVKSGYLLIDFKVVSRLVARGPKRLFIQLISSDVPVLSTAPSDDSLCNTSATHLPLLALHDRRKAPRTSRRQSHLSARKLKRHSKSLYFLTQQRGKLCLDRQRSVCLWLMR